MAVKSFEEYNVTDEHILFRFMFVIHKGVSLVRGSGFTHWGSREVILARIVFIFGFLLVLTRYSISFYFEEGASFIFGSILDLSASVSGLVLLFTGALSAAIGGPCTTLLEKKNTVKRRFRAFMKRGTKEDERALLQAEELVDEMQPIFSDPEGGSIFGGKTKSCPYFHFICVAGLLMWTSSVVFDFFFTQQKIDRKELPFGFKMFLYVLFAIGSLISNFTYPLGGVYAATVARLIYWRMHNFCKGLEKVDPETINPEETMDQYLTIHEYVQTINKKWGLYWTIFLVAILIELGVYIQNVFEEKANETEEKYLVADAVRLVLMAVSLVLIQLMSAVTVRTMSEEIEETVVQWYRMRKESKRENFIDELDRLYNVITSTVTLVMISLVMTTIGIKVPELGL